MGVGFPTHVSVSIEPATVTITDDTYQQFTAIEHWDDGSSSVISGWGNVFWRSSDPDVAEMSNNLAFWGRAFGASPGTATITVNMMGHSIDEPAYTATATLTVVPPPPPSPPPAARFSLGFGTGTLDPYPTWTPIDTHPNLVTSYSIDRGRSYELDQTDAGRATVEIMDPDGILDPTNPTGPYYGQIRPLLHAVLCRHDPVTDTWEERFRGYIDEYTYAVHPSQQVNQLTVTLVDLFEIAGNAEMQPGQFGTDSNGQVRYDVATSNERIAAILTDLGIPGNRRATLPGSVNLRSSLYSGGESPLSAIQEAADAEFPNVANVYCDRHGRICFHGRTARFDPAGTAAAAGGAWDYHHWKAGDRAAITASPTDTAQVRALGFTRGLSKIINVASALELGVDDDAVAGRRVTDPASIAIYGMRSWSVSNLITLSGDLDATYSTSPATETKRFATFYVENYAQPRDRITGIEFRSLHPDDPRAPANWQLLTKVDIGDTIEITVATAGGGGFTHEQYFVEGVHENVEPLTGEYDNVTVTLDLSPRSYYSVNPWSTPLLIADPDWPATFDSNPPPRSPKNKPSSHGGDHGHGSPDPTRFDAEEVGTGIEPDDGVAPLQIADEGAILTDEPVLNFTGTGVTATTNTLSGRTDVTIPGADDTGTDLTGYIHYASVGGPNVGDSVSIQTTSGGVTLIPGSGDGLRIDPTNLGVTPLVVFGKLGTSEGVVFSIDTDGRVNIDGTPYIGGVHLVTFIENVVNVMSPPPWAA